MGSPDPKTGAVATAPTQLRDGSPEAPQSTVEALPKLELRETGIARKVAEPNAQVEVSQVGEYSIVIGADGKTLTIIDRFGNPVTGSPVDPTELLRAWSINAWDIIDRTAVQKSGKVRNGWIDTQSIPVEAIAGSTFFQAVIEMLRRANHAYLSPEKNGVVTFKTDRIASALRDGNDLLVRCVPHREMRYDSELAQAKAPYRLMPASAGPIVMQYDSGAGEIELRFRVCLEDGTPLPPHQWKPIDLIDRASRTEYLAKPHSIVNALSLEGGYAARMTPTAMVILRENAARMEEELFRHQLENGAQNIVVDPQKPSRVFYCKGKGVTTIHELDTSGSQETWRTTDRPFPREFATVRQLAIDPTGQMLLVQHAEGVTFLDRTTLAVVHEAPGLREPTFDPQGRLRAVTKDGMLTFYETNIDTYAKKREELNLARLAEGLTVDPFAQSESVSKAFLPSTEIPQAFHDMQAQQLEAFTQRLGQASTVEDLAALDEALERLRGQLRARLKDRADIIAFVVDPITAALRERKTTLGQELATRAIDRLKQKLALPLSLHGLEEARTILEPALQLTPLLDRTMRTELETLSDALDTKSVELFREQSDVIRREVGAYVEQALAQLDTLTSTFQFDGWVGDELPKLKLKLGRLQRECPLECTDARTGIDDALTTIHRRVSEREKEFTERYREVRSQAALQTRQLAEQVNTELAMFLERVARKRFASRSDAEAFIASDGTKEMIETLARELEARDPKLGHEALQRVKSAISNTLGEIERAAAVQVEGDGRQMVAFGARAFPMWEATVAEKFAKTASRVTFIPNAGPGAVPGSVPGDVGVEITSPEGKKLVVRAWQGLPREDVVRYAAPHPGAVSYLTAKDYQQFTQDYADWRKPQGQSAIRKQLTVLRAAITEAQRALHSGDANAQAQLDAATEAYRTFIIEKRLPLLQRLTVLQNAPAPEFKNGTGYVPEWRSHWVVGPEDEALLERMAMALERQTEQQDGLLMLNGHAGTGKDVLIRVFANRTRRPYFPFDCSRWTTESDLSEELTLESSNGVTTVGRIPSVIVKAITTPGSIMYFNEFNAMPEQAQIFLHALFDEKRSMTLKTQSGKLVKAHPTVLFVASMNPDYPGTFKPQMATRSRIETIQVPYPPLLRDAAKDDPNQAPAYAVGEALKLARSVRSLEDFALEQHLPSNEFVKIWDAYVNGIGEKPDLTQEQRFDLDVILAVVQFAQPLREAFMGWVEKRKGAGQLSVEQPFTLREMRRIAWYLGEIPASEKQDPLRAEDTARTLIERHYLANIDKVEQRNQIIQTMRTWTVKRRTGATI